MTFILPSFGASAIATVPGGGGGGWNGNTWGVDFDGTNDFMEIPTGTFDLGTSNWAFSFWFKFDSAGTYGLLDIGNSGGSISVLMMSATSLRLTAYSPANNVDFDATVSTMATDTWQHFLAQKYGNTGGSQAKTYLNGVLLRDGIFSSTTDFGTNTNTSSVGKLKNHFGDLNLPGNVDEFAYFSNSLSDGGVSAGQTAMGDIAALYNGGVPADISAFNPVAWYRMGDSDTGVSNGSSTPTIVSNVGNSSAIKDHYSLDFDGTNSWLDIGDISSLTASQTNLSLSYWINETSSTAHQGHLGNESGLTGAIGYFSSYYYFGHWKTGAEVQIVNPRPTTGVWHNIIVTMNNSYIKVFVDKILKYYDTTSGSTNSSLYDDFNIGKERNNVYGRNKIDEVAFFQSTLSDGGVTSTGSTATGDVADIYNSGVPTDLGTNGLNLNPVGWWRMGDNDSGTGTTVTDQGSGSNDGTLTNSPTFSTDTPTANAILTNGPTYSDNVPT